MNSAAGSFGLSFGLAFAGAIMLAVLSFTFTDMAQSSTVLPPAQQQQVATVLEHDAEIMSNTQLKQQLAGQPAGDPGRDHPHQHRSAAHRAPGGPARAAHRRSSGAGQLVSYGALARPEAEFRWRDGLGLNLRPMAASPPCARSRAHRGRRRPRSAGFDRRRRISPDANEASLPLR